MKRFSYLPAIVALTLLGACHKQETEAERNAEVERQVQQRLAADRQAQEQQHLSEGQVDLDQRMKDLESRTGANATATAARDAESEREPQGSARSRPSQHSRDDSGREATASYSTFYTKLESQGEWRETSDYGYVWQPRVAQQSRSWRPYTNGHWVYTDAGWTWISEEPFGWATYHYGRWTRLRNIGWAWVPGEQWAPAWVSWRKSNDYVGWAPLPPEARFERSSGIHNWADNYYDIGPDQYCFVPTTDFGDQRVERAIVSNERNVSIVNETTNVTNITYSNTTVINQGPNYEEIRARSREPIQKLRLERQVTANFDSSDPRAVVRGEVVEMPAPIIAQAQPVERPRNVRETVTQVVVDHGWEGNTDRQTVERARAKMKSESTPPPNAPSRTFVKPAQAQASAATAATATPSAAVASTPASTATAIASATPNVSRSPSISRARPVVSPSVTEATATPRPMRSASPTATVEATASPAVRATATPSATPRATASIEPTATASPVHSATPRASRPAFSPAASSPRPAPSASASMTPEASASSAATAPPNSFGRAGEAKEQRRAERQQRREERGVGRPNESPSPAATPVSTGRAPAATASPAGTAAADSSASPSVTRKELRKEERRARRAGVEGSESASPTASPSPQ